jgi:hypothetical protein
MTHRRKFVPLFGVALLVAAAMAAHAQVPTSDEIRARLLAGKAGPATVVPACLNVPCQAPASMSLCFTCGGDWPIFAGAFTTPVAASERGAACFGGFSTLRNDHRPFLCAR